MEKVYDIPGFSKYGIRKDGKVVNKKTGRVLRPTSGNRGSAYVILSDDNNVMRSKSIRKMMVEVFGEPGKVYSFSGKDPSDNRWENFSDDVAIHFIKVRKRNIKIREMKPRTMTIDFIEWADFFWEKFYGDRKKVHTQDGYRSFLFYHPQYVYDKAVKLSKDVFDGWIVEYGCKKYGISSFVKGRDKEGRYILFTDDPFDIKADFDDWVKTFDFSIGSIVAKGPFEDFRSKYTSSAPHISHRTFYNLLKKRAKELGYTQRKKRKAFGVLLIWEK